MIIKEEIEEFLNNLTSKHSLEISSYYIGDFDIKTNKTMKTTKSIVMMTILPLKSISEEKDEETKLKETTRVVNNNEDIELKE